MPLRIIFMGTPDFAVPTLEGLAESNHEIVAVYSQPPRPAGRGMEPRKSPVHQKAEQLGIKVHTPTSLRSDQDQSEFAALKPDVAVVVAYGLLLPKSILDIPVFGCYNGHASLLPRWRGAAPIQRSIMAGDATTGVMVMKMEEGLDTGPVALTAKVTIDENMTAGELHDDLMAVGADLMVVAMAQLEDGTLKTQRQSNEGVTYASKIHKTECRIDWNRPARDVHNHIRGLSPFPGAWCEMELAGKTTRIKVLSTRLSANSGNPGEALDAQLNIGCATGSIIVNRLQKAGKQAVNANEFLLGNSVPKGSGVS